MKNDIISSSSNQISSMDVRLKSTNFDAKSSEWYCRICDKQNPYIRIRCEVCGRKRGRRLIKNDGTNTGRNKEQQIYTISSDQNNWPSSRQCSLVERGMLRNCQMEVDSRIELSEGILDLLKILRASINANTIS